jgi:calmodulin|tara:strand:+ start:165 stop:623 length:459 start_codon:yes stop_codon:yes gene_type:complete
MALAGDDLAFAKDAFSLFDVDEDGKLKGDECSTAIFAVCGSLKGTCPTQAELTALPGYGAEMDEAAFLGAVGGIVADDKLTAAANPFAGMDRKKTGKVKAEDLRNVLSSVGDALNEEEIAALMAIATVDGDDKVDHAALWEALKKAAVVRAT